MPVMNVTILRKRDPSPWEALGDPSVIAPHPEVPWQLAILEAGCASGAPSIALRMDLADGRVLIAETSLGAWLTATAAFRGVQGKRLRSALLELG